MGEPRRVCSKCGNSYAPDVIFCPKDGTPLGAGKTEVVEDPYVGLTVQGQFRVEQLIGIGAMGRVYRAHQQGIERQVAIKILHRELLRNSTVMGRFHREAKVASRLTHPNVVQILMTGTLERVQADIGGEAYLVMEYLDGISLRSALAAAGGALPLPRSLHIILQVCDAVGEAHDQGIVHRDLKPENVMLVRRGDDKDFAKVLDFGVARIEWADSTVATQAGAIFGTARYISPEGAHGEPVGPASDVYSIATMLFQCLAGKTPFDGESPVSILVKQTSEEPPKLRSIHRASYVPEPVARVITTNLAKDPNGRCQNARELGRALVEAARGCGLSPDDLVVRSTLLGSAGALQLQSMQRTRALKLTPEAANQIAPGPPRQPATELVDAPEEVVQPAASDSAVPGRGSVQHRGSGSHQKPPARAGEPLPAAQAREAAPGSLAHPSLGDVSPPIEPTLTDESPAEVLEAAASAPATAAERATSDSTEAGAEAGWEEPRASLPDPSQPAPGEAAAGRARRVLVTVVCFVIGAALALIVAYRLGVFEPPGETLEAYLRKSEAALEAGAWDRPAGANLRDLTRAALSRWPGNEAILSIQRRAASRLLQQAHDRRARNPDEALRLARLAVEFDPQDQEARALLASLAAPTHVVEEATVQQPRGGAVNEPSASPPKPDRARGQRTRRPRRGPSAKPAPSAGNADEGRAVAPPAPPTEGRWL